MAMKNKFEKFLIALSGLSALAIFALGIKVEDGNEKLANIQNDLAVDPNSSNPGAAIQDEISSARDTVLNKAAHSPLTDVSQTTTIKTVVPGQVITQVVPVTTSSSTTSKSSSKTTKTS